MSRRQLLSFWSLVAFAVSWWILLPIEWLDSSCAVSHRIQLPQCKHFTCAMHDKFLLPCGVHIVQLVPSRILLFFHSCQLWLFHVSRRILLPSWRSSSSTMSR